MDQCDDGDIDDDEYDGDGFGDYCDDDDDGDDDDEDDVDDHHDDDDDHGYDDDDAYLFLMTMMAIM